MNNNKKTMLYLLIISIIFLVLTYIFSLAIALEWEGTNYLSFTFLFGISSGIFASILVALLLEYKSYRNNKSIIESKIFANLLVLYLEIHGICGRCKMYLENQSQIVPKNLIAEKKENIDRIIKDLFEIGYSPIGQRKNKFYKLFDEYVYTKIADLQNWLLKFKYLDIAINNEKIELLKNGLTNEPTSESHLVKIALEKLVALSESILKDLDLVISSLPDKKTCWSTNKISINSIKYNIETDIEAYNNFFNTK